MVVPEMEISRLLGLASLPSALQSLVSNPAAMAAITQLSEALEVQLTPQVLQRAAVEARSIEVLGAAMADLPAPISAELARSLQAEENWWRKIEAEHKSLSSMETAEWLGKSPTRAYASHERQARRMLGYKRGNSFRYPVFQFDRRRRTVLPVIEELLALAHEYDVPDEELVMWLCTPSGYFDEQDEPVNHFDDAESVLTAARETFGAVW